MRKLFGLSSSGASRVGLDGTSDVLERGREALGVEEENNSCLPSTALNWRLAGFGIFYAAGWVLISLSIVAVSMQSMAGFAILFAFGNITAVLSTGFLVKVSKQVWGICFSYRWIAVVMYLIMFILTFVLASKAPNLGAMAAFVVISFLAASWYVATYIPKVREAMGKCCGF